jgi:hypothetical protein
MIVLVCRDLLFGSKVGLAARAAGAPLKTVGDCAAAAALGPAVRVALVDLGLKPAPGAAAKIHCFGSHVDAEALRAARAAGADEALPNSAFVQRLDALVALPPA